MADPDLFQRARSIRAAIKAHEELLSDEHYNTMRTRRLEDLEVAVTGFTAAVDDVAEAKSQGLDVASTASVPHIVDVDDPTEFIAGNDLTRLEETLHAATASIDGALDQAFASAIVALDAHPAGTGELELLAELDLDAAEVALEALTNASARWKKQIEEPKRPDIHRAQELARELDEAWAALAASGIRQEQVDLLRRLSGDCVPLTTVTVEDVAWLFDIGFAATLKLCSNSARK
jgi:hypothetical protein